MDDPKRTVLCDCSRCILHSFVDEEGVEQHGTYQRPSKAREHKDKDRVNRTITRETTSLVMPDQHGYLPTRSRDNELTPMSSMHGGGITGPPPTEEMEERREPAHRDVNATPGSEHEAGDGVGEVTNKRDQLFKHMSWLQSRIIRLRRSMPSRYMLIFKDTPVTVNDTPSELDPDHPDNAEYVDYLLFLQTNITELSAENLGDDPDLRGRRRALLRDMQSAMDYLDAVRTAAWQREIAVAVILQKCQAPVHCADRWFTNNWAKQPFLLAILLVVCVLHTLSGVALTQISLLLATMEVAVYGAFLFQSLTGRLTRSQQAFLDGFPRDMRTVLRRLSLEPEYVVRACCTSCCASYPPNPVAEATNRYPQSCTFREFDDQPECGARLLKPQQDSDKTDSVPIKTFAHQTLQSWLAQLFSRPGMERIVAEGWSRGLRPDGTSDDIMGSPAIRTFVGPDNTTLYSVQPHDSIHLVFSLFVDWFNPFGNKKAGKSHSVGAIYMACLNLPPDLRYKPENIYLAGIIPGPHEPSLDSLNHFLTPIVDELITFWRSGVYLSRTASFRTGRLVRAAIIPLVCDMPALRKVAGFAAHSHKAHFCSHCYLRRNLISQIYDRANWRRRTYPEHLEAALRYRNAATAKLRDEAFQDSGVRWSELLRLPYWDPTQYSLVDAMHNLYLGELRHHCREVLGIDVKERGDGKSKIQPHTPDEQRLNLKKAVIAMQANSKRALCALRKGYLTAIAELNAVTPTDGLFTKAAYATALLTWYHASSETKPDVKIPVVGEEATKDFRLQEQPSDLSRSHLLNSEVLNAIRSDIKATSFPSWVQPPPHNFGSPSHGKLRASQWRSVCHISLIITLVRLWGTPGAPLATKRNQELLANFVDLVVAVDCATRRTMSPARAEKFDFFMYRYVSGLRSIFDHALVPNHHLSLHLAECLKAFGPVQGWWAFPFERFNGLIARIKTNSKSYEMPTTFMRYFNIGATLRWMMSLTNWPDVVYFRNLVTKFEAAYGGAISDAFATALPESTGKSSPELKTQPQAQLERRLYHELLNVINARSTTSFVSHFFPDLVSPVLSDWSSPLRKYLVNGQTFASANSGKRNSYILFRLTDGATHAGQISSIFEHSRQERDSVVTETFLAVRRFTPLDDRHLPHDPYRKFPDLETCLCYANLDAAPTFVIRPEQLVAHFAAYVYTPAGIDQPCVVVRSLDQALFERRQKRSA